MTQAPQRAVRLLIVDRSPAAREQLRRVFDKVPDIDVLDEAATADKALRLVADLSPNLILVDCDMPKPGSFALVADMMQQYPVPVVMLTRQGKDTAAELEARALETGAVALVIWSTGDSGRDRDSDLIRVVRAMSEVKVVRRRDSMRRAAGSEPQVVSTPSCGLHGPHRGRGHRRFHRGSAGAADHFQRSAAALSRTYPCRAASEQGFSEEPRKLARRFHGHVYFGRRAWYAHRGRCGLLRPRRPAHDRGRHGPPAVERRPARERVQAFSVRALPAPSRCATARLPWECCSPAWAATEPRSCGRCVTAAP